MFPYLLLAVAPLVPAGGDDAPFSLAKPPTDVERLVARLHSGEKLSNEEAEAAKRDCFRPYFPLLVMRDVGLREGTARTVFVDYYLARHKERRDGWAKDGRLDLIAESQVVCARGDDSLAPQFAAEWALILTDLIDKRAAAVVRGKVKGGAAHLAKADDRFELLNAQVVKSLGKLLKDRRFEKTAAAPVVSFGRFKPGQTPDGVIDFKDVFGNAACFADLVEFVYKSDHAGELHVVSGDVWIDRKSAESGGLQEYFNTLFVANGSVDCGKLQSSVIIADGDVHLQPIWVSSSYVVIARGDISADDRLGYDGSLLAAGGTITGKQLSGAGMLLAKGGLLLSNEKESKEADPNREKGVILDGVGPAELGIRWFELADVGLEVAADGKAAMVKAVAEKSPFRGHLRPKDVLKEVNAVPVTTPDAARRALRRAYILGFAVVTYERDGKAASRLVPIDDLLDDAKTK